MATKSKRGGVGSKLSEPEIEEFDALGRVLSCLAEEGLITETEYQGIVDNTNLKERQASIFVMLNKRTLTEAVALFKLIKGIYPIGDSNSNDELK